MNADDGHMTIMPGTHLTGQIRGGEHVEIRGSADGSLVTRHLTIREGGSFKGSIRVESADIHGTLRGDVSVRNLLSISASGDVEGQIEYGQLAMQAGSNLVADVRNVPPQLAGDFELEVVRGEHVVITPEDLNATDVDDAAEDLTYTAANLINGCIARSDTPGEAIMHFTQAEINAGAIVFAHNGAATQIAGFDVTVMDAGGASAGPMRPVLVRVRDNLGGA